MQAQPPLTKSLVRAMDILKAVVSSRDGHDPATIADELGLPRPTVYRLLSTLQAVGMVERHDEGTWLVGPELVRLARSIDLSHSLVTRARATMERVANETGEVCMLAINRGPFHVDVISQIDVPNLLGVGHWVGKPIPTHASAAGKVVLARLSPEERARHVAALPMQRFTPQTIVDQAKFEQELDAVARQGYGQTIDELESGLSGFAAAAERVDGLVLPIICVYGPTARICGDDRERYTDAVLDAAARLGDVL